MENLNKVPKHIRELKENKVEKDLGNDELMEQEEAAFNKTQSNIQIQEKPVEAAKDSSVEEKRYEELKAKDKRTPDEDKEYQELSFKREYTIEIIKDELDVDITRLPNPDPRYAYRFLNTRADNLFKKTGNVLHAHGGWKIGEKEHLLRIGIPEGLINADGHYRLGNDLVLAFMPKELFKEKVKVKQKKSLEPLNAVQRLVTKGGEGLLPKEKLPSSKW